MGIFNRILKGSQEKAEGILLERSKLFKIINQSSKMITERKKFSSIKDDLNSLLSLSKDWAKGDYRNIGKKNMLLIISALVYLVNPFDIVPDFILGIGMLDDFSIFLYLISKITNEIEAYKNWKREI